MKEGENQDSQLINQAEIDKLFSQLTSAEVDDFYQAYQLWLRRQRVLQLQQELQALREKQAQNTALMQSIAPSAIALSAIAQLRFHEVNDTDLLERMLERGEEWLDNTMQLLARCEALNVIQGNYTQWCEHALEGAYEWMWSMNDASLSTYFDVELPEVTHQPETEPATREGVTEAQLLQKLMSEEGEEKPTARPQARITRPLPVISPEEVMAQSEAFMPLDPGNTSEEVSPEPPINSSAVDNQHDEVPADTTEETNQVETGDDTNVPTPAQEATHEMPQPALEDEADAHESLPSEIEEATIDNQAAQAESEFAEAPQSEQDDKEQLAKPAEEDETQAAQTPQEEEAPGSVNSARKESTRQRKLRKKRKHQAARTLQEKGASGSAEVPPVEQTAERENTLTDSPTALSDQEEPAHAQIAASEQAVHAQWPYVYQEAEETWQTAKPATEQNHHEEQNATTDDGTKPHAADDSKSRGLIKRSLDRFRRR